MINVYNVEDLNTGIEAEGSLIHSLQWYDVRPADLLLTVWITVVGDRLRESPLFEAKWSPVLDGEL